MDRQNDEGGLHVAMQVFQESVEEYQAAYGACKDKARSSYGHGKVRPVILQEYVGIVERHVFLMF